MIKDIIEGWSNYTLYKLGIVDEDKKKKSLRKLEFCKNCELKDGSFCSKDKVFNNISGCGCHLIAKSYSDSPCPLGNF